MQKGKRKLLIKILASAVFVAGFFMCANDSLAHNKFIFIHHSTGGYWIANASSAGGGLGSALDNAGIYVRNIGYDMDNNDFDPPQNSTIADTTDIGHWWLWFADTTLQANSVARRDNVLDGLNGVYETTNKNVSRGSYTTTMTDPGGENDIIMIKSCYPSANIYTDNGTTFVQMRGRASDYTTGGLNVNTVSNVKALYNSLLDYFKTRTDKIFIISFTPPLLEASTTQERANNARSVANWLVNEWLQGENWENKNVYVFDQFNEHTHANNHHTYSGGQVVHYTDPASGNFLVYPTGSSDNHPSGAGHQKATADFVPLLQHWIATYEEFAAGAGDVTAPARPSGLAVL